MTKDERSVHAGDLRKKAQRARALALSGLDPLSVERLESFAQECEMGALASDPQEPTRP